MLECPRCGETCHGGDFGNDAWCKRCELIFATDWDYVDSYEGIMSVWTVTTGRRCTEKEWVNERVKP